MGHQNPITSNQMDDLIKKAIQLEATNKLASIFKNHRSLQYYPQEYLIEEVVDGFYLKNDYKGLKDIFSSLLRRE